MAHFRVPQFNSLDSCARVATKSLKARGLRAAACCDWLPIETSDVIGRDRSILPLYACPGSLALRWRDARVRRAWLQRPSRWCRQSLALEIKRSDHDVLALTCPIIKPCWFAVTCKCPASAFAISFSPVMHADAPKQARIHKVHLLSSWSSVSSSSSRGGSGGSSESSNHVVVA